MNELDLLNVLFPHLVSSATCARPTATPSGSTRRRSARAIACGTRINQRMLGIASTAPPSGGEGTG